MRFLAERTQFRRDRVVVPIARKHLLPDPLFFRCIFSGRSRGSERHVATRIPLELVPLEANQIISKDGIVTSGRLAEVPAAAGRRRWSLLRPTGPALVGTLTRMARDYERNGQYRHGERTKGA